MIKEGIETSISMVLYGVLNQSSDTIFLHPHDHPSDIQDLPNALALPEGELQVSP